MNRITGFIVCLIVFSFVGVSKASATGASGAVVILAAGYDDGAISFSLSGTQKNPASCTSSVVYVVKQNANGASKDALAILMYAKSQGKNVWVSVRDDICHTSVGTDAPGDSYPVVQRIVITS